MRFQAHTYEADNHFRWPSTHWIFRDRVSADAGTPQAAAAKRFLVRDREHVERQWPSEPVTYPYANISSPNYTSLVLDADLLTLQPTNATVDISTVLTNITFWNASSETTLNYTFEAYSNYTHTIQYRNLGRQLLSIRFYSNPVSIWHQRQDFKHWILDQCADIGGFILFAFLLFGTPCVAIQWRLYQARVVQDRYRLKFNKVLRGLKERKYKKKEARREKMLQEE